MRTECRGSSQDDEECDQVRECHADEGVELDPLQLCYGILRRPEQRFGRTVGADFFHFLRSLPEKQVGADGGAEYCNDQRNGSVIPCDCRPYRMQKDFSPWHIDREHSRDVSEQAEREPFQVTYIFSIWRK